MRNIGICDNRKNHCEDMKAMILNYSKGKKEELCVKVWYSSEEICEYLTEGNNLDVLFLEVELGNVSGIQVGEFIRNKLENRRMQIVYISEKQSYAQYLFETQPMDFLIKPITQIEINKALQLAEKISETVRHKFEFQVGKEYYYVPFSDIFYFTSQGKKIILKTEKDEWIFYGKLKEIAEQLPENFMMVHQSFVVNRNYIFRYNYEMVEMEDGTQITISKANRKRIRHKFCSENK